MQSLHKKVLFSISGPSSAQEHFPVIEHFCTKGWKVFVLVGYSQPAPGDFPENCRRMGAVAHHVPEKFTYKSSVGKGELATNRAAPGKWARRKLNAARILEILPQKLRSSTHAILLFMSALKFSFGVKRFASRLFAVVAPDLVFSGPYHSCGWLDDAVAHFCQRQKIPHLCIPKGPFHWGVRERIILRAYYRQMHRIDRSIEVSSSIVNRILGGVFPAWVGEANGIRLFPFHPSLMLAAWIVGLLSKTPWRSGDFDVIFVEAVISRDMLLASGYSKERIILTGKPILDQVMRKVSDPEYERQVFRNLRLQLGESFALVNVQPAAEHEVCSWEKHWENLQVLLQALRHLPMKKILALHPFCHAAKYEFITQQYGYHICLDHRIIELYPYCSIAVSYPSSTNALALHFAKPLVIYDFWEVTRQLQNPAYYYGSDLIAYDGISLESTLKKLAATCLASRRVGPPGRVAPNSTETIYDTAIRACA